MTPLLDPGSNKPPKDLSELYPVCMRLSRPVVEGQRGGRKFFNEVGFDRDNLELPRVLSLIFAIFRKDPPVLFGFEKCQTEPRPIIIPQAGSGLLRGN